MKIKSYLFDIIQIFCKAGHTVTTHITSKRGNATEVASCAKENGYEMIVCCGGDGTLNEVINGIILGEEDVLLGYIPSGSTNDFARTLGISTDIIRAAKDIVNNKQSISIDIGKFSENKHFVYIASFGMFTSVSYNTQQSAKNALGHIAYLFEGIANMGNIETLHVSFKADGKIFEDDYIYGGITNSTSVGGIFKFNDDEINLNDGLFEVLMIKKPKNANDYMRILTGLKTSDLSDTQVFDFCKASEIELKMPENVTWSLDGESARGKMNMTVKNLKGRITIIK